jgi:predicted DNA-binding protein (UPF0251 family)
MRQHKFFVPVSSSDPKDEVVISEEQIKLIYLEAKGYNQQDAADYCGISRGTAHNALTDFNAQSNCHNAQGRVGWAIRHGVLIIEKDEIVIAPQYCPTGNPEWFGPRKKSSSS